MHYVSGDFIEINYNTFPKYLSWYFKQLIV